MASEQPVSINPDGLFHPDEMKSLAKQMRFANDQGVINIMKAIGSRIFELVVIPLQSVIGILGDFGDEVDVAEVTASVDYTPAELQAVADKLDEVITALQTMGILSASSEE